VVAFIASLIVTGLMVLVVLAVAKRRQPGTPLTWGEAFVAGTFVFGLLFMLYGIVPDRWIAWADSPELAWRSDSYGIPTPFARLFEDGITFFGRGRIMVSAQTIRDIIASGIYIGGLVLNFWMWLWWQKRGRGPATPELETSAYGRPLVKRA
jgi:hypothetical protein